MRTHRSLTALTAALAAALALVGCTSTSGEDLGTTSEPETEAPPPAEVAVVTAPEAPVVVASDGAADLAAQTSGAFFGEAPVAVVTTEVQMLRGASAAHALGVPVLVDGEAAAAELGRLGTDTVLAVGDVSVPDGVDVVRAPDDPAALAELVGAEPAADPVEPGQEVAAVAALEAGTLLEPAAQPADAGTDGATAAPETTAPTEEATATADGTATAEAPAELPATERPDPVDSTVVVMTTGDPVQAAAVANARTAGAQLQVVPGGDPRATSQTVQETAANAPEVVVGLGTAFGDAETLQWRTEAAATGVELPGGGQLVLPGKTYVALYGTPITSALGVLGEQGPEATIERARAHAAPYEPLTDTTVVPALEIISTVASAFAGEDGDYSAERPVEELRPLVDLAHEQGLYVVLDLQPGRTDFVTQARRYEELLALPNVGLALDPEWRLRPDQVHLVEIGQVDVAEVNQVVTYLADLTRAHDLPQKLLVLHQFQVRMIPGVDTVDQSRSEVAVLIHADGQGGQGAKRDTWATLRANAPSVPWWGWKNFYDEDLPMLTPEQTMQVEPAPNFISYQ